MTSTMPAQPAAPLSNWRLRCTRGKARLVGTGFGIAHDVHPVPRHSIAVLVGMPCSSNSVARVRSMPHRFMTSVEPPAQHVTITAHSAAKPWESLFGLSQTMSSVHRTPAARLHIGLAMSIASSKAIRGMRSHIARAHGWH